jgi:hypothetical protein
MGGAGGDGAGAAVVIPAQRTAVRMWLRGRWRVAENILGELQPGAQALS